ncbi:MAG: hypothetical protein MI741_04375 [Rhodospirillales bacterium]|nr:hypothetical protein [Rhodospirillales bacterium]
MSIGKLTARAAGVAADAVGDVLGGESAYPETEYGLAAFLFQQIEQSERGEGNRGRAYYLALMKECLAATRQS